MEHPIVVSRRQFLRGSFSGQQAARRPPWHRPEGEFADLCTRCSDCLKACPTGIIVSGGGAYPEVDFAHGECTFCGDCARACPTGALRLRPDIAPWQLRATIGDTCLSYSQTVCRSCAEACGVGAIRLIPLLGGAPVPLLDGDACTGCGACVSVCPAATISVAEPDPIHEPARKIA